MGFPGISKKREKTEQERLFEKQVAAQVEQGILDSVSNPQNPQEDLVFDQLQDKRSDLMRWQQDLGDEVETLKHELRSEVWDGEKWIPQVVEEFVRDPFGNIKTNPLTKRAIKQLVVVPPLANESFVHLVDISVKPFISRNLINSNFNEGMIWRMLRNFFDDLIDNMADNCKDYDIKFKNYDIITRLIKNVVIAGPFRALNDGERKHQRTINKRVEAFTDRAPGKRDGRISSLFNKQ